MKLLTRQQVDDVSHLEGKQLDETHYDVMVDGELTTVLKPDGSPLLIYVPEAIPRDECLAAFDILRKLNNPPTNRAVAVAGKSHRQIRRDGTKSKTIRLQNYEVAGISSAIIGYYDRYVRFPYCRQTAFNADHPELFKKIEPFISHCDQTFSKHAPERYAAQRQAADNTSQDFVIQNTAFSTVTVNKNWSTLGHYDSGDFADGMGVMSCLRAGRFSGGALVFPAYRVAVQMRTGGVCLADVHELHGNTKIVPYNTQPYERVSCVLYFRKNMMQCGTAEQELDRAKNRKTGDKLYDD